MEGIIVTIKAILPSVPATVSHLHWERRQELPGLGWRPLGWWRRQVYSGLRIAVLMAGLCSNNKDKDHYQGTQQIIQSINISQTPSVGI